MKKTICLLIVCLMCAFSYGKTTPVMAEEKEKVMIVTGSDDITKVVVEKCTSMKSMIIAVAFLKDGVIVGASGLFGEQDVIRIQERHDYLHDAEFNAKINPEYIDFEVREKPNFYNYKMVPINSKPFKQNVKFERSARNAI